MPHVEGIDALLNRMEPFGEIVPARHAVVVAQLVAHGFAGAACILTCAVRPRRVALFARDVIGRQRVVFPSQIVAPGAGLEPATR